ncbi:MAG: hypothetical protein KAY32_00520 [Candidatus Eisenbacteria sp.]|nr:hypothetical protein [Candidatus Eisenbacteria bacterium]
MRYAVLLVATGLLLSFGMAHATVPDATYCSVTPCDTYGAVLVCPDYSISAGAVDPVVDIEFTVNVRNASNDPIPGAFVQTVLGTPGNHHVCNDAVLTATTDGAGNAVFNIAAGGCTIAAGAAVQIVANSVTIRTYDAVKSPDLIGSGDSDGIVSLEDFSFFAGTYGSTTDPCTDYKGSGMTELEDFSVFARCYGRLCEELAP